MGPILLNQLFPSFIIYCRFLYKIKPGVEKIIRAFLSVFSIRIIILPAFFFSNRELRIFFTFISCFFIISPPYFDWSKLMVFIICKFFCEIFFHIRNFGYLKLESCRGELRLKKSSNKNSSPLGEKLMLSLRGKPPLNPFSG